MDDIESKMPTDRMEFESLFAMEYYSAEEGSILLLDNLIEANVIQELDILFILI